MNFTQLETYFDRNRNRYLTGILAFFAVCFLLLSLGNHYVLRTYAYDLGLFNNTIYDYAHFRWNDNTIKLYQNILSDHFTLLHLPFSIFYWVFGSYTLLIFQVAAIIFGAWGAYKMHYLKSRQALLSLVLLLHFLFIWGIYSALAYDYHDNIIAAMLVPWFFYYFYQQKWRPASIFFGLILVSKENMALWAIFLGLGLALHFFRHKKQVKAALLYALVAAVYFIVVVKLIIPALAVGDRSYDYVNKYAILGQNFSEIILNTLKDPVRVFLLLFQNHTSDPTNDYIKAELHVMILLSGGFALLFRPAYLLMLLPIYAQKLFTEHFLAWGINFQYSIEFVPILNFALADLVLRFRKSQALALAVITAALTFTASFQSMEDRRAKWFDRPAFQFYKAKHYRRYFNVAQARAALKLIPEDVPVSASSVFVPHLAFRDYIFEFPFVGNAQYVMYLAEEHPENATDPETIKMMVKIKELQQSPDWEKIYDQNYTIILKRRPGTPDDAPVIFK